MTYTRFRKARTANKTQNWHPIGTRALRQRVQIALIAAAAFVVLPEQVRVDAQGNVRLGVTEALRDRDDVHTFIDQL
jgi:hypothetical protein